ncbi:MAG TPA: hypothetical protein GXZ60_04915 [Intrasporangiaceae bacterium]|nr:hypothetical protein [Intrasporangiaceae bacterium]
MVKALVIDGDNGGVSSFAPALLLIPVALVLVLVISAVAKLNAPVSTASAVRLLRLPEFLDPGWVSRTLPPGELVLALAMLLPWLPVARVASIAALLLFVAYWVIIARAMTFDPRPSCGCFGQIGDQRVTWKTVVRNTLLVAGAAVFVWMTWTEGLTTFSLLGSATDREWVLLIGAAYLGIVLWLIAAPASYGDPWWRRRPERVGQHQHQEATVQPVEPDEEEYVRVPIPDAFLLDRNRNPVRLIDLTRERPAMLVFVNCSCGSTHATWERLAAWAEKLPVVQVLGVETAQYGDLGIDGVAERLYYDPLGKAWTALQIPATSSAVLLGADGLLAGGPVEGLEEVEQFVDDIAEVLADAEVASEAEAEPEAEPAETV